MKKIYLLLAFTGLYALSLRAQNPNDLITENPYQGSFEKAYAQYPLLKKGVLEAVSYTNTRLHHLPAQDPESCTGIPRAIGVMGLVLDGKNFFHNNLIAASRASGISEAEICSNPEKNILAYATLLNLTISQSAPGSTSDLQSQLQAALLISELPEDAKNAAINFSRESFVYSLSLFLDNKQYQNLFSFPDYRINFREFFGDNLDILSAPKVKVSDKEVTGPKGKSYKAGNISARTLSADYPPALWVASPNFTAGRTAAISAVTIHDTEGSYASTISWFQNTSSQVSAHYVVRSSDGQITQMVLESNKAWHVGSENSYTIGIEHEGYAAQTGWYTTAMYTNSSALVADICSSGYGINPKNLAFWPWAATTYYNQSSIPKLCCCIKGHMHYPNQTHTDPGPNWNWETYYRMVNSAVPTATVYTTATGNFYDTGGAGGNAADLERSIWTISPTGAAKVTLNFSSFNLENTFDYLYLYDGNSINAPLIGKYTGTTSPGTISSSGGSITAEFRSDCSTTSAGWAATWSINGTAPAPDNVAPTTTVSIPGVWQTGNFNAGFAESDNAGGSGLFKSFYQVIDLNASGDWRANDADGFFSDDFSKSTISPEWTQSVGTWVINSANTALEQTDQTNGNTNIYAPLNQNLSNVYLYNWSGMISGTGTSRRAGLHIFCDSAAETNRGNNYFVWFRVDQSLLEFYRVAKNTFSLVKSVPMTTAAGQWYDWKIVYDRTTGLMEVFQNNSFIGSYTDPNPISSGSYISFRSGNCDWQIKNFKVYRSRTANAPNAISVGACPTCMIRFQNPNPATPSGKVKSVVRDSSNNFSTIVSQDVNVDWSPPINPSAINDGTGADADTTYVGTQLSNNWRSSFDPNSGLASYSYAIGTTAGGTNTVNWTMNQQGNLQDTTVTVAPLTLIAGTTYYTSVKATNGAGLSSGIVTSDGILYLTGATGIKSTGALSGLLHVYPNPFSSTATVSYTLADNVPVRFVLVDVLGRQVEITAPDHSPGIHQLSINSQTLSLAKGIYFLEMIAGEQVSTVKLNVQ
jgi:N-acetyl-anhydromuramyl-L-alanine amidase AmpD